MLQAYSHSTLCQLSLYSIGLLYRSLPSTPEAYSHTTLQYVDAGGKLPIQRQPFLVQYKHQANPLLSMNNYTPLVISRNDKNKQLTLLSQLKLA